MGIFIKLCGRGYTQYLGLHPTIMLKQGVRIDHRCEIREKTHITLGKGSILYKEVTLYKDREGIFSMGEASHIAPYGYLLIEKQHLTIGDHVAIGPFCALFCSTNSIPKEEKALVKDSYEKGSIAIGDNVLIGAHCVILPNTVIEDNVVVAANSTVKGVLSSGYLYGGNPAKRIKALFDG